MSVFSDDSRPDLAVDLEILDRLEDIEIAMLSWGLVDGGFEDYELLDHIEAIGEQTGDSRSAEEIRSSLEARVLLVRLELPNGPVWRTRMAEAVRLSVRLRQLFPAHMERGGWSTASNLVSDYRFVARPRRFPHRNTRLEGLLDAVNEVRQIDHRLAAALGALGNSGDGSPVLFAPFQVRSTVVILEALARRDRTATLIAAGTGSGKTKAFYLPALAYLATLNERVPWTKLVAVYPRTELLKDQLTTALLDLRQLHANTGVRLTLGAFYGDTPLYRGEPPRGWDSSGGRSVCPFLDCPTCGAELTWFSHRGEGALECSACTDRVLPNELLLSRHQMQNAPPDVLLTTTETLNRQLSNDYTRHVFGAGMPQGRRPRLLLLDEVHTYTELTGAQAAILLRRWRHAVGSYVHTVGLSATIIDGATFMADLAGVAAADVSVIEPTGEELVEQGKEYLLALRGDPASGTALLSTTIQTAMLARRMLDRARDPVAGGASGSKLFVFTDDLDVTNRLLHFLRNAEGQDDRGRPDPGSPLGSLANLRSPVHPQYVARLLDGQAWDLCRAIGHRLDTTEPIVISRTSSQDPGLERRADMVVATASLEVGLDDTTVGAVLQHKAPRNAAQFIQRRGRGGRTRSMRPWTMVVLSDYGRDRLAFQAWDALFDPQIRPSRLPVGNRYVLRVQATYALLDWLAERLRGRGADCGYVWQELGGPDPKYRSRRRLAHEELRELLERADRQEEAAQFIGDALSLGRPEIDRLFWDPPRAVLATVVPTLLRRIESGWRRSAPGAGTEDLIASTPLPDFVPSALFQDLLLPEVEVEFPATGRALESERMTVQQAIREFAPGRVTHRFAVGHTLDRLWLPPGDESRGGDLRIQDFVRADPLVERPFGEKEGDRLRVLRPWKVLPTNPHRSVANSSNARPVWRTLIEPIGRTVSRAAPGFGGWEAIIREFRFHLHQTGGRLVLHRAATASEATVTVNGQTRILTTRFVDAQGPVALGFRLDADGLSFDVLDPGDWDTALDRDPVRARGLRADWFRHCVREHPALRASTSIFKRDWLAELVLGALTEEAVNAGSDLELAIQQLQLQALPEVLERVLTVVFQSVDPTEVTGADAADEEVNVTRLHQDLIDLAAQPHTAEAVASALDQLLSPRGEAFNGWLRDRYLSTVAAAVAHAAALSHEDAAIEDLVVDVGPWRDGEATVWISEQRPGGVGVIEGVFERFQEDPRRFWRLVSTVVDASEHEVVDLELSRIVDLVATDDDVAAALDVVRNARGQVDRTNSWRQLLRQLDQRGIATSHGVRVSLSTRVLRPASSSATDALLFSLLHRWTETEAAFGLEMDARVFAHLASRDGDLQSALQAAVPTPGQDRTWRFNAVLSLLWPRGSALRSRPLQTWQPYHDLPLPERTLLAERLTITIAVVDALSSAFASPRSISQPLEVFGAVVIAGSGGDATMRRGLIQSLVTPVDVGVLELHPRIVGVRRSPAGYAVTLEVSEVLG